MTIEALDTEFVLPFDEQLIVQGGKPLADYLRGLVQQLQRVRFADIHSRINSLLSRSNTDVVYFGSQDENGVWVDGSWKLTTSGGDFLLQRMSSGVWVDAERVAGTGLLHTIPDLLISSPVQIYGLSHNSFTGYLAAEHINHGSVSILTTGPLSGGGTIAANRTLSLLVDASDLGVDGSNQLYVKDAGISHDALAGVHQNVNTAGSPRFARLYLDDANTYLDRDGSGNLTLTDAVIGTRTLKQLGCPTYKFIRAAAQSEGDLHLSNGTTWAVSKAMIDCVRVVTSSTDWDLWLLQNDNGYAADDANIPALKIAAGVAGNAALMLNYPYQDEDASNEVHLYWVDNSGANTADIYIVGFELI